MLRVSEDGHRRQREEGHVESYRQIGRALLDLQQAAGRVFDEISKRTAQERDKLAGISRRIQSAKARIDILSRSDQALTIRSPSRYPTSSIGGDGFIPLFHYKDEGTDGRVAVTELLVNGGLNREFGTNGTLELFQFFSEENTGYSSREAQSMVGDKLIHSNEDIFLENLIKLPKNNDDSILTVDSNASYSTLDSNKQELPPSPPSLLLNNFQSLRKSEDFVFSPTAQDTKHASSDQAMVSDESTSYGAM